MKQRDLFSKEWCDIVFEHRNKKYGAYKLRAEVGRRYKIALFVIFGIFVFLAIPPLILYLLSLQPKSTVDPIKKIVRFEGIRIKEARPLRRPPKKVAPDIEKIKKEDNEKIHEKENMATILHLEDKVTDFTKVKDLPADSIETLRKEAHLHLAKNTEQTEGVIIDSIPSYPTGLASFMRWLNQTMVYPPDCVRRKVQGRVLIAFVVEKNGSITDIHIVKGADGALNREALRVISIMSKWIPGKKFGQPIRSQVTLPIDFVLSENPFDS